MLFGSDDSELARESCNPRKIVWVQDSIGRFVVDMWWQTEMTSASEQQVLWLPSPRLEAHVCGVPYSLQQSHLRHYDSP